MAINNFSTELFNVTVNLRQINDWGETDPPFVDTPIDQKTTLRRGLGGRAARLGRINPGRAVSMFLQPGSPDSAYIQGLMNSGANITISATQIGTLEASIGTEGVIINDADNGRGGISITDDQYLFEFNNWNATKGGE